jgi:RNA polymerase sigma-70 factor (ECF subfamily)
MTRQRGASRPLLFTSAYLLVQLTATHADRLYAVVLRLVGNRSDAEDVVQETLLRAWRGIGRFRGRSMYFTWLYRIAVNEANRALEKRAWRAPSTAPRAGGS